MATRSDQSKGGRARAASLSAKARSDIARLAAEKRWGDRADSSLLPKETHSGVLRVGDREMSCSVLENGIRVFSIRGLHRLMGTERRGGKREQEPGGALLPSFLAYPAVKAHIPSDLMVALISPIQYRPKHGGRTAFGYQATLLPLICEAILDAAEAGGLRAAQRHIADMAGILLRAFARVGVIALVDEATGYQEDRAKDELARILEAYVQAEYRPWTRMFPEEFFRQIYRVHKWEYKPGTAKRTPFVGHLINKYIYGQLPPGVLDELRRVNPVTEAGYRRRKHFQHLTADTGNEHLDRQITSVITLMRISDSKEELAHNFAKAFGKPSPGIQQRLPLLIEGTVEEVNS